MSGNASVRGYLLQTIICSLDALQDDSKRVLPSIEPHLDSEKVDVVVKSSQNQIRKPQMKRWAKEWESSVPARSGVVTLRYSSILGTLVGNEAVDHVDSRRAR